MQINFTETQKAQIHDKLKQSASIVDVNIGDKIVFKLSNGAKLVSKQLTQQQLTFLKRQVGFEKEFIDTIFNIFMSL